MESLVQTVAPVLEPVTLERAKLQCRCQHTLEDTLFHEWIRSAREWAEAETGRQPITATWRFQLDAFPEESLELPRTPVIAVTSVQYKDADGATQTLDAAKYQLAGDEVAARLVLAPGESWPATEDGREAAVTVTWTAGYGAEPKDVPANVVHAMLLLVGASYLRQPWSAELLAAARNLLTAKSSWRYR